MDVFFEFTITKNNPFLKKWRHVKIFTFPTCQSVYIVHLAQPLKLYGYINKIAGLMHFIGKNDNSLV